MYKPLADSTLHSMTKKEIIELLRTAEHNAKVSQEWVAQQAENLKDWKPVVHGHWICEWDQESGTTTITCSQCKCNRVMKGCYVSTDGTALWDEENYCPDCEAKMDGGADHEAD